jgi:hypothetical protein
MLAREASFGRWATPGYESGSRAETTIQLGELMTSTKAKLATAALLALGLLALFAGPASAMKQAVKITHPAGGLTGTMYLERGGVATDSTGNVYVRHEAYIEKYNSSGVFQSRFSLAGSGGDPRDIEVDSAGNIWTISQWMLSKYSPTGTLLKQQYTPEEAWALAADPSGLMWVLCNNNRWGYNANVEGVSAFGHNEFGGPETDIDIDSTGNVWMSLYTHVESPKAYFSYPVGGISADNSGNAWISIAGEPSSSVRKISPTGTLLDSFGGTALGRQRLHVPNVATGPGGAVWVATETQGLQKWVP